MAIRNSGADVLKCDAQKFFPDLDHAIVFANLTDWVRSPDALDLIRKILAKKEKEQAATIECR